MTERPLWPRMAMALIAVIGLLDALYLSLKRLTGGAVACPVGGGCGVVQASPYSVFLGIIPLAYLGVVVYLGFLILTLVALNVDTVRGLPISRVLLPLAVGGTLFSAYLTYLQVAVIGAVCAWCVASGLCQLGILLMTCIDWRNQRQQNAVAAPAA